MCSNLHHCPFVTTMYPPRYPSHLKNEPTARCSSRRVLAACIAVLVTLLLSLPAHASASEVDVLRSDPCIQNPTCAALYGQARDASARGDLAAALDLYRQASAWVPASQIVRFNIARILDRQGQTAQACAILRQLESSLDPQAATPSPLLDALLKHLSRCPPVMLPRPPSVSPEAAATAADPAGQASQLADLAQAANDPVPTPLPALNLASSRPESTDTTRPRSLLHHRGMWAGLATSAALFVAAAVTGALIPPFAKHVADLTRSTPGNDTEIRRYAGLVGDLNIAWPTLLVCGASVAGLTLGLTFTLSSKNTVRLDSSGPPSTRNRAYEAY